LSASYLGQRSIFLEICRAIEDLPTPPGGARAIDLLLEGMARAHTDGRAAAMPILKRAAKAAVEMPREDVLRWGWLAPSASHVTWDPEGSSAIFERQAQIVREAGALAELPVYLSSWAQDKVWNGDLAGAALLSAGDTVAAATGSQLPPLAACGWQRTRQGSRGCPVDPGNDRGRDDPRAGSCGADCPVGGSGATTASPATTRQCRQHAK
jgi:hypothetical protein